MNTEQRNSWNRLRVMGRLVVIGTMLVGAGVARADTRTWKNNTTGDWSVPGNWVEGVVPADGDDVIIANSGASAILSSESANLSSLTLSRTLTFTNWTTALIATNVTIQNNGIMTLPPAFTTSQMSNRVWVVCSNLTINAGGKIDVNSKGYAGQNGPGKSLNGTSGGGYGGFGGSTDGVSGLPYGSAEAPVDPGSGSGATEKINADGGGAVFVQATGVVTVNGLITANSLYRNGGTGSGGGIYITCHTFAGVNGLVCANGGGAGYYAGGGGGRIAVIYNTVAQNAIAVPGVVFSVNAALPVNGESVRGDVGTLYFPDNRFLTGTLPHSGQWVGPGGLTRCNVESLIISNSWLRFPTDGFVVTVTNDMLITAAGRLDLGGSVVTNLANAASRRRYGESFLAPELHVGGNLTFANAGCLYAYSVMTNAPATPDYGVLVSVTGDVVVASNSWVYSFSHPTNGGSPLFRMSNLTVLATNSGFNADYMGYDYQRGPGSTNNDAGAGYGGFGGYGASVGALPYGSAESPVDPGSGGKTLAGGGVVRIQAGERVTVNGTITANGQGVNSGGAGSGGGITIVCNTLAGSNGLVRANGGRSNNHGGGGGGRIAVSYGVAAQSLLPVPDITFSVNPALSGSGRGDIGTLYFPDNRLLDGSLLHTGQWLVPADKTIGAVSGLTLSNNWLRFPVEGYLLTVSNDALITASGCLELGGSEVTNSASTAIRRRFDSTFLVPELRVGGNLTLTNAGSLYVYSAMTNPPTTADYGALVSAGGEMLITTGCWLYVYSHPTNGGSPLLQVRNLTIQTPNAGIKADFMGFIRGFGPGKSTAANSGGGYGGKGGGAGGGPDYGSSNAPVDPGSSSIVSYSSDGQGGGAVRIQAARAVTVNGLISANGGASGGGAGGGAGSGGGVYIVCKTFSGTNGAIQAKGGNSTYYGGGGGGRIAIWRANDTSSGVSNNVTAAAGTGWTPVVGTIVWGQLQPEGSMIVIR